MYYFRMSNTKTMKSFLRAPSLLLLLALLLMSVHVQGQLGGKNGRIEGKAKFMPIPYLNYDRSMGFAIGAVPLLMFNPVEKDTISPSSLVGGVFTRAFPETNFSVGMHVAVGIEDWGLYFQIGEVF